MKTNPSRVDLSEWSDLPPAKRRSLIDAIRDLDDDADISLPWQSRLDEDVEERREEEDEDDVDDVEEDDGPELWETVGEHEKADAMPGPIVESIRSVDGPELDENGNLAEGIWDDHLLPSMTLPGFGEKYDDCGDPLPHGCENCGSVVNVGRTCARSVCPRCAATWCRKRATQWAGKLMALKGYRYAATDEDQHYHHTVISPPSDFAAKGDVREEGRKVVKAIMDELDVEGIAAYHPWRGSNEEPEEDHPEIKYDDPDEAPDDDRGEWKNRLFNDRSWDDVRDELRWSPHWHVVGVGGFQRGGELTKAIEDATGWVIHRVTPPEKSKKYSIRDDRALARVLSYVFSHTGLRETAAGNMRAEFLHPGKNLNRAGFEATEETKARADKLVREEAWKVLGIPSATMTCHEDATHWVENPDAPDEVDEDELEGGEARGEKKPAAVEQRTDCSGELVAIDEYDDDAEKLVWEKKLESDEWRATAENQDEAALAFALWKKDTGPPGGTAAAD